MLLSNAGNNLTKWNIKDKQAIPKYDFKNRPRRQDIKDIDVNYVENGSLYISTYDNLINKNNR